MKKATLSAGIRFLLLIELFVTVFAGNAWAQTPPKDFTNADYERVRLGMSYPEVAKILGSEGVDAGIVFYVWKDDNLKVGFKDSKYSDLSLISPGKTGPAFDRLFEEIQKLVRAGKNPSSLSYEDVAKIVGRPGEKYDVKRCVWKNSKKAQVIIEFKNGKAIEKQAMGFPAE
jgi:hypothetical protein